MATVGEAIDARAKECIDLYETFREDDGLCDQASGLATHDLIMQKYIAGEALARAEKYIRVRAGEFQEKL